MATVTPNFNWPVPTSTDLVKDGATAIEALGDSIDASLVDLKGGTTGQVLSKTSGTDMDFTWVTTDDANAIQNSIVDAKGDLISATANDTPARLAVGANGETLVADSSTSTGLRYIPAPNVSNPVLNSAFDIWQRGTSFTTGARIYGPDRFYFLRGGLVGGVTVSRQVTGDTTNLPNVQYSCRVQRDSGTTSTAATYLYQEFETVNSIPFAGKTVTLSFYARRGANYSPASNGLYFELVSGTGTDQNIFTGFTGGVAVGSTTATLTTTWQRFTFTGTVPTNSTQLGFYTGFSAAVGTAGAADFFEITGIQIDVGAVPLPFRRNGATIQGELAACQRYFEKSYAQGQNPGTVGVFGTGIIGGVNAMATLTASPVYGAGQAPFKVTKRTTPTMNIYDYDGTINAFRLYPSDAKKDNVNGVTVFGDSGAMYLSVSAASTPAIPTGQTVMFNWTASAEL